jgi:putative FmdB family regulatory protein
MPIYNCECQECSEKFEFYSGSIQVNLNLRCPKCGGDKLSQQQITEWQDSELNQSDDDCTARESS